MSCLRVFLVRFGLRFTTNHSMIIDEPPASQKNRSYDHTGAIRLFGLRYIGWPQQDNYLGIHSVILFTILSCFIPNTRSSPRSAFLRCKGVKGLNE